jgi:tRNA U54 and U55 pseudouridine synthase Pus10
MEFLKNFREYDAFEDFCRDMRNYCPSANDKIKNEDENPTCKWCRKVFSHGMHRLRSEVIRRLEN